MLLVNCKNYEAASGRGLARMLSAARAAAKRHGTVVAIAPPHHMLAAAAGRGVPVFAQHVDTEGPGGTTGRVVPELLAGIGVAGSIINHSERRVGMRHAAEAISRLEKLGMTSVACAGGPAEAGRMAALGPDYVAVEPPSLIGTGRSVSVHRPGVITAAARAVSGGRSRLLCGAGITSGADAQKASELGASGVLVASGVVKAPDWGRAISDLARFC
ncbi:MAG: triose-phosphate isomerase [Nitrosopumilus sp.]|nr:triose-phosphate isomerase [Nitrosopumilus sp.]CAI9831366.1 Triosephosphate isomerase [Nitrosopumilaceae archaeon]MDA7940895.1 triose-phosphate isomerase [Nitrosopumilus sp.]MDA7943249.1 triose-phosphate isomerase [Nitrosopumilus sp.]MDA7944257.1 triose-phosphate isomerase [Nitrosopumilus sp.]